jgi:opacity protein-like surface antigen
MTSKSICTFRNGFAGLVLATLGSSSPAQADAYAPGTFTFKPINANIASYIFRRKSTDSVITANAFNFVTGITTAFRLPTPAFRSPLSFGFHESDRNGTGYGVEMGYVIGWDWEIFGRAGYSRERGLERFLVGNNSFDFKTRNNYGLSLGARHYFDLDSAWKPFIALAAGYTSQGETKAQINAHSALSENISLDPSLGTYKLLKRQNLFSFELSAGTDYVFNKNWALTCTVALRYNQRGGSSTVNTPGFLVMTPGLPFPFPVPAGPVKYADHKQRWYIPVTFSLKFMF